MSYYLVDAETQAKPIAPHISCANVNRDPLMRKIKDAMKGTVDGNLFEACACDQGTHFPSRSLPIWHRLCHYHLRQSCCTPSLLGRTSSNMYKIPSDMNSIGMWIAANLDPILELKSNSWRSV